MLQRMLRQDLDLGRITVRVVLGAALGYLWGTVIIIILGHLLPQGWGVKTWWGPYLIGVIFLSAVGLCYWALVVHERILIAKRSTIRPPSGTESSAR
jgi:hypothetical protein